VILRLPQVSDLTLTVDSSAKPIELIPVRQAVAHLAADMISPGPARYQLIASDPERRFRSQNLDLPAPLIVLFPGYVELSDLEAKAVTRKVLFARDRYSCQYCGRTATPGNADDELTIDHVKPIHLHRSRLEATTWENCVAACKACNNSKGGLLPRQCGMMPRRTPRKPHYVQLRFSGQLNGLQRDYIRDYFGEQSQDWLL
jgi:5-methylcytosine-specific restriction endonuclease McrA